MVPAGASRAAASGLARADRPPPAPPRRLAAALSDTCSFTAGIAVVLAQVALVRELFGALEGHEVSVALSLAVWLCGIGLGAALGGLVGGRLRVDAGHLVAAIVLLALAAVGGLAVMRDAHSLLGLGRGVSPGVGGSFALAALGVGPAAVATGLLLPLFARASGEGTGLSCGPARFYMIEALGTGAGGALAPLLVGRLAAPRLVSTAAAVAAAALVAAVAAGIARPRGRSRYVGLASLVALWGLALAAGPIESATQARRTGALGTSGVLVETVESPYGRLDVVRAASGAGRVVVFENGAPVVVAPDLYGAGPALDLTLLEHPAPRDVLVVGSSPPDVVRVARAHGADEIAIGAVDPWILAVLQRALDPADRAAMAGATAIEEDPRFRIASAAPESLDLVAIFAPDPTTAMANRYYTREAFAAAARALRPGGVLALGLPWSANAPDPATAAYGRSVVRALRESFPWVVAAPGIDVMLFASRSAGVVTSDPGTLAARASGRPGLRGLPYPSDYFRDVFPPDRTAKLAGDLGLDGGTGAAANADLRPVAYLERVIAHLERGAAGMGGRRSRAAAVLRALAETPPWVVVAMMGLVPLLAIAGRRSVAGDRATGAEAAAVGMFVGGSGMALQMLLLVAYQNHTGRLYVGYALLTGAFMAGLAAGTRLGGRLLARAGGSPRATLARVETVSAAALLALSLAAGAIGASGPLLLAASAAAGCLTGTPFPGIVAVAALPGRGSARAGAWASAGDHVGAGVGAFAATLVLLPAFGLRTSVLILAAARVWSALTVMARA